MTENTNEQQIDPEDTSSETAALDKLLIIAKILEDEIQGFKPAYGSINLDVITSPVASSGIPFDNYGMGDIRWSFSKGRNWKTGEPVGILKVWFTNGYEDRQNPTRVAITAKLRDAGLMKPNSFEIIL
jgi:hypothetical protein